MITPVASVTAVSAAFLASLYASAVVVVFPSVDTSFFAKVSKSFFAVVNSPLFAGSFNNVAAVANFAFNSATFNSASFASAFVALSPLAKIAFASCFAAAIASLIFSTSAVYAFALSSVFPVVFANSNSAFTLSSAKAAFCSGVIPSTNPAFAASNAAFLSLIAISASNTSDLVTSSLSITFCASVISFFPASLAFVYAPNELEVLSVGSASSVSFFNFAIASVKAPLSTSSFF